MARGEKKQAKPVDVPDLGEPFVYSRQDQVPPGFAIHRRGRLSYHQVNRIVARAYENPIVSHTDVHDELGETKETFATVKPDFAEAFRHFEESHEISGGLWIPKGGKK